MKHSFHLFLLCLSLLVLAACNGKDDPQGDALKLDFSALQTYLQDGAEVAAVSAVERDGNTVGYVVYFADGSNLTLLNDYGSGENAKAVKSFGEDSSLFWFETEDGEKVTMPKAGRQEPFSVELSGDEVEIADGGTVKASYKVSGADSGLEVTAMVGEGWTAGITKSSDTEGTIEVTAPSPITADKVLLSFKDASGKQVVRALRLTTVNTVQRGNIGTYVYHGIRYRHVNPAYTDDAIAYERYKAVPDAGVQIMTCDGDNRWDNPNYPNEVLTQLDFAERVGLKLAVCMDCYLGNDDYPDGHPEEMRTMVKAIKDHPALWGYQLIDEPNADYFPTIYKGKQVILELDQEHLCYVNLHGDGCTVGPNGSYHTASYEEYLERCVNECHPDFLTFDVYPCISDKIIEYPWYSSLELVSSKAKKYGLEFWAFAATCRFVDGNGVQAKPSMETLRLQDYTNLAYGAQCLEYFTWAATSGNCSCWVCDGDGNINTENPTFECLQAVNKEVQNRAFVFDDCDVKWTAHYGTVPFGCVPVDINKMPSAITSYYSANDSFLFSLLENDGGDSEYLCIVSRTYFKATQMHLRLKYPVQTVERDGSLKTYNPGDYDFTVDPGDIIIIKTK